MRTMTTKQVVAYYQHDIAGKKHLYRIASRGVSGEIYLKKGPDVPDKVTITLKVRN